MMLLKTFCIGMLFAQVPWSPDATTNTPNLGYSPELQTYEWQRDETYSGLADYSETPCEEDEPELGLLMQSFADTSIDTFFEKHRLSISGTTQLMFTASTNSDLNSPIGWPYLANEFLLNMNYLRFSRAVDPEADKPTHGFRSDTILPGSAYRFTLARGLFDDQLTENNGLPPRYGVDPIQFYLEMQIPNIGAGLNVKLGRFFSPYGIESIDPVLTPFPSLPYTFFYDPYTHTGLLTELKLNDTWSLINGIATGSDVFIDPAANATYIGGIRWAPEEGSSSFALTVILGSGEFDVEEGFHNPQIIDFVYSRNLTDSLLWQFNGLYGFTTNVPGLGHADWYGIVNYLSADYNEKLRHTTRLEFFDDRDGQRTGFQGLYTALTSSLNYKPQPWLWIRPELRLDHNDSRPFEGKPMLFTATLDLLLNW